MRAGIYGAFMIASVAEPALAQSIDQAYTAKIREYTTEPFFLTPLVDHLPSSSTVPTPLTILGHIAGAPDVLSYPEEIYRYMRAVDAASDRVTVFNIGYTEEGREMILVVVANEETISRLDDYKAMSAQLADPRTITDAQAEQLIATAKPMYWATGAIHSPETGSPEMLMELVYRLAVEESDLVRAIRDNVIVMVTPVIEVDGRAKVVDLHMARRKDPSASLATRPLYWGKYVAHDNNRDGIGMSLQLQRNVTRTFLDWHPTILHDLHESAAYLYTSTGRGPYNAWIDPIVISEWNRLAHREVERMAAFGVPGVYTHDFYDGWAPNYMMWVANMRNAIGRFYETQGAGDASTRIVRQDVDRQWHRPNTPLPEVVWSIRNNVNLQQSAILIAMNEVATHRSEFLRNLRQKAKRSIAKAQTEGPAAYVFPADDPRPGQQARLLELLQRQGIEVHRATQAIEADETTYAAGSYVIRMDQPYSRAADMLLDLQYYNPADPRPYDDTGWTLGPLFNVETRRIENPAVLVAPMELVSGPVRATGTVLGDRSAAAYLIDYNADNNLTAFRFKHRDLRIEAAERAFETGGRQFAAGTFIIRMAGNPADIVDRLTAAATEFGFTAVAVPNVPSVDMHPIIVPRIAVMHTWTSTQSEGWLRIGFDEYGIPYDYISVHDVRDLPRLRDRFDVIVFGPSSNDALSILRGLSGDRPIPWKSSSLTPNIGKQAETDDMRGGLELSGVLNLANFVKEGGTLITLTSSASVPVHFGLTEGLSIREPEALWAPGGVFRTERADRTSPLAYGYGDELGVYFNDGPVFATGSGRGGRDAADTTASNGSTTARRSGRGAIGEQDRVQARREDAGRAGVEAFRDTADTAQNERSNTNSEVRTILRFEPDVKSLLISGGLTNGEELANAPALVDVRLGTGHVVLFGFNPFWRGETLGSYGLVFNALLHHGSLDSGTPIADR
ncbi:MAG: M14 family zinc carboxypeptidase [Longimicrobiales bacterium]